MSALYVYFYFFSKYSFFQKKLDMLNLLIFTYFINDYDYIFLAFFYVNFNSIHIIN